MMPRASSIVILTGAGISAESGVPTFRDADGLWEGHRIEDVATPEAFDRDPEMVLHFYNLRRAALATVKPNTAHLALARLQREHPGKVAIITQNVDDLHERAGSENVIHMHGTLMKALCTYCRTRCAWTGDMRTGDVCSSCGEHGTLRPDIVWFGEMPYHMDRIENILTQVDLFVAIGTSGHVYPAAGFVSTARYHGAETFEINNTGTAISEQFEKHRTGTATVEVPKWVEEVLRN
jgi:NAD-dependent deacetylase